MARLLPVVLAFVVLVVALPASAQSGPRQRAFSSAAVNYCQATRPVYDRLLRKRPLGIRNVSARNAWITCAFNSQGDITQVTIGVDSVAKVFRTVRCTGFTGTGHGSPQSINKKVDLPPLGRDVLTWSAADFLNAPPTFPDDVFSILCQLPPNVSLGESKVFFTEDVGF